MFAHSLNLCVCLNVNVSDNERKSIFQFLALKDLSHLLERLSAETKTKHRESYKYQSEHFKTHSSCVFMHWKLSRVAFQHHLLADCHQISSIFSDFLDTFSTFFENSQFKFKGKMKKSVDDTQKM